RGVSLVAPACSILSAPTSMWSTRKPLWGRARHSALCAPTSGSSRCVQARMVKRRLPWLREKWGPPPNRCHPEHVFGKGRTLLQVMGGQGERRDFRPTLSPQDVPVLGCDGTARQHTVSCHRCGWPQYSMRESGLSRGLRSNRGCHLT